MNNRLKKKYHKPSNTVEPSTLSKKAEKDNKTRKNRPIIAYVNFLIDNQMR